MSTSPAARVLWPQIFTQHGLIPSVTTAEGLVRLLNDTWRDAGFRAPADAMQRIGVPANGSQIQEERLRELLRRDEVVI